MKLIYSQMVIKLVRAIMIKLLWNICTCVYTYGLELFRLNIYLHVISTNFETGLPRYNLCIFRRGWNLSCYRSDPIIMKILSEQFVLKLCQIDNLCQSWGKLKLLLMTINLTFSGGQKLRISEGHETFSDHSFETQNNFSETLSE